MGSMTSEMFILYDNLPGVPELTAPTPVNGYDNTTVQCCVTAPAYRPGTKHQQFQDATVGAGGSNVANKGYYTMVYAKYTCYSTGTKLGACDVGGWVTLACGSTRGRGEMNVTNDISGGNTATAGTNGTLPLLLACTSMDNSTYGWFLCGGVCPNHDISALDDLTGFLTDGSVAGGCGLAMADDSYAQPTFLDTTDAADFGRIPAGLALEDDT